MNVTISLETLKKSIRNIPDFPKKGIQFKDITTLLKDTKALKQTVDQITGYYKGKGITKIVGVESRGFIIGGALAHQLNVGFVPVRKPGKLPAEKYSKTYDLEYGTDTVEIHKDALESSDIVLLHDDLLATGGTTKAVVELLSNFNVRNIYINYLIELDFLEGRKNVGDNYDIYSLVHF